MHRGRRGVRQGAGSGTVRPFLAGVRAVAGRHAVAGHHHQASAGGLGPGQPGLQLVQQRRGHRVDPGGRVALGGRAVQHGDVRGDAVRVRHGGFRGHRVRPGGVPGQLEQRRFAAREGALGGAQRTQRQGVGGQDSAAGAVGGQHGTAPNRPPAASAAPAGGSPSAAASRSSHRTPCQENGTQRGLGLRVQRRVQRGVQQRRTYRLGRGHLGEQFVAAPPQRPQAAEAGPVLQALCGQVLVPGAESAGSAGSASAGGQSSRCPARRCPPVRSARRAPRPRAAASRSARLPRIQPQRPAARSRQRAPPGAAARSRPARAPARAPAA